MAKAEKGKTPKKGDQVKVISGPHKGKSGVLKHIRDATGSGIVELDNGDTISATLDDLAAA